MEFPHGPEHSLAATINQLIRQMYGFPSPEMYLSMLNREYRGLPISLNLLDPASRVIEPVGISLREDPLHRSAEAFRTGGLVALHMLKVQGRLEILDKAHQHLSPLPPDEAFENENEYLTRIRRAKIVMKYGLIGQDALSAADRESLTKLAQDITGVGKQYFMHGFGLILGEATRCTEDNRLDFEDYFAQRERDKEEDRNAMAAEVDAMTDEDWATVLEDLLKKPGV